MGPVRSLGAPISPRKGTPGPGWTPGHSTGRKRTLTSVPILYRINSFIPWGPKLLNRLGKLVWPTWLIARLHSFVCDSVSVSARIDYKALLTYIFMLMMSVYLTETYQISRQFWPAFIQVDQWSLSVHHDILVGAIRTTIFAPALRNFTYKLLKMRGITLILGHRVKGKGQLGPNHKGMLHLYWSSWFVLWFAYFTRGFDDMCNTISICVQGL